MFTGSSILPKLHTELCKVADNPSDPKDLPAYPAFGVETFPKVHAGLVKEVPIPMAALHCQSQVLCLTVMQVESQSQLPDPNIPMATLIPT
ncbi:UNVERIFIED_CONTAM: hypothetical protein K2H54_070257 [Gekko kuhli]